MADRLGPDRLWGLFERVVPKARTRPRGGGRRRYGDREVLAVIFFVVTMGCTWAQVPPVFGPSGATAQRRFMESTRQRVWPGGCTPPRPCPRSCHGPLTCRGSSPTTSYAAPGAQLTGGLVLDGGPSARELFVGLARQTWQRRSCGEGSRPADLRPGPLWASWSAASAATRAGIATQPWPRPSTPAGPSCTLASWIWTKRKQILRAHSPATSRGDGAGYRESGRGAPGRPLPW
ncbi:transposase [Streptomyces olivochromogenes]|uniref:Transposase n=1 Tax=Streptomyces olivochromogenes TaxID=1963 RepID=A0A286PGK5_STROL|nr:transposase [Streptomyces olivochromogenes]